MHPLVQAVTAGHMTADLAGAWSQAATLIIAASIPDDPQNPSSWPVFGALLPHAQAALSAESPAMEPVAHYLG